MVESEDTIISLRLPISLLSAFDLKIGKKSRAEVIRDFLIEYCKDSTIPLVDLSDLKDQLAKATRTEDSLEKLLRGEKSSKHEHDTAYESLCRFAEQLGSNYGLETNLPLVVKRMVAFECPPNCDFSQKQLLLFIDYLEAVQDRRRLTTEIKNVRRANN